MQACRFVRRPPASAFRPELRVETRKQSFRNAENSAYRLTRERVQKFVLDNKLMMRWEYNLPEEMSERLHKVLENDVRQCGFEVKLIPAKTINGRNEIEYFPAKLCIQLPDEPKKIAAAPAEFDPKFNPEDIKKDVQKILESEYINMAKIAAKKLELMKESETLLINVTDLLPDVVDWIKSDIKNLGYHVEHKLEYDGRNKITYHSLQVNFEKPKI